MNALLPYLKQIADALNSRNKTGDTKRDAELSSIAKSIGNSTITNNNVSIASNENVKEINNTLKKGLVVTVRDGSSEYEKSVFALMFEMLQSALFVTVTENNQQVTKSLSQLVSEQNTILQSIENAIGTNISTMNSNLSDIVTNTQKLGSVDTHLSSIDTLVNDTTGTRNPMLNKLQGIGTDTSLIRDGVYYTGSSNVMAYSATSANKLINIESIVNSINNKIQ